MDALTARGRCTLRVSLRLYFPEDEAKALRFGSAVLDEVNAWLADP